MAQNSRSISFRFGLPALTNMPSKPSWRSCNLSGSSSAFPVRSMMQPLYPSLRISTHVASPFISPMFISSTTIPYFANWPSSRAPLTSSTASHPLRAVAQLMPSFAHIMAPTFRFTFMSSTKSTSATTSGSVRYGDRFITSSSGDTVGSTISDGATACLHGSARVIRTFVPMPRWLVISNLPPCSSSTMATASGSPSPVPLWFLPVDAWPKGSNTSAMSASSIPHPESVTVTSMLHVVAATPSGLSLRSGTALKSKATVPPAGVNLSAFDSTLVIACTSKFSSPRTSMPASISAGSLKRMERSLAAPWPYSIGPLLNREMRNHLCSAWSRLPAEILAIDRAELRMWFTVPIDEIITSTFASQKSRLSIICEKGKS
mmetsp:Transcript_75823/g.150264  ORF Transcript_75823/g.150264 Transcript_75823/m.150264 type:complete len:375 (-) Transcript_75823:179-1303(-)